MKTTFEERHAYEKGFAAHYAEHLRPKVWKFERARKKAYASYLKRMKIAFVIGAAVLAGMLYLVFVLQPDIEIDWLIMLGGLIGFGLLWFVNAPRMLYVDSIKQEIFPKIIQFLGDYRYTAELSDRMMRFNKYGIVPSFDDEASEDSFVGRYKDVQIELFETKLTEERGSGKSRHTVTVFRGLVIELDMNKSFSGKTVVRKDRGVIGNWFESSFSDLERVKLEDPRFESQFEVFSDDQIEARYLLTPSFMDRLVDLRHAVKGDRLQCSFYQEHLLLLIDVPKDMFEPGPFDEVEDFMDDAHTLLAEMNGIFSMIDTLKLNEQTGL